ncbi:hypothetical protein FNYG_14996 [Fusarium nygamai]|uniref:Uncharacterized protein n=1 Tax=Gibberella nygamai TaxID=42673 RepID=A0A2K0UN87_GIBNY|nr:hypothetical protein FNYG_14996 [Fusarium nygamai]
MSLLGGLREWRLPISVSRVDVDLVCVKEELGHCLMSVSGGPRERRLSILVSRVDVDFARLEEQAR